MASHESPIKTKLYDLTGDEIKLDEVEWIAICLLEVKNRVRPLKY